MLSRTAAGSHSQPKKNGHNTGVMISYRGDLDSDVCPSSWKFCPYPLSNNTVGGKVGLSSVPHGKLVAYKYYIKVIKLFNFIALQ